MEEKTTKKIKKWVLRLIIITKVRLLYNIYIGIQRLQLRSHLAALLIQWTNWIVANFLVCDVTAFRFPWWPRSFTRVSTLLFSIRATSCHVETESRRLEGYTARWDELK